MKKALGAGILASFFFAFTFILNRSMHLGGGSWVWSASLRYLFTLPVLAAILAVRGGLGRTLRAIAADPWLWLVWNTVGFGLFYAPLSYGSQYGEAWLTAATWQVTIVAGVLLTPLFGEKLPLRQLGWSGGILVGIFLLQMGSAATLGAENLPRVLLPILLAAVCYPLGNRVLMRRLPASVGTLERVFGMTLCSMPFWLVLSGWGLVTVGPPAAGQMLQAVGVALFSGVAATLLFFWATDQVKKDPRQLALIEATQSGEVVFSLLGGILFLGDPLPGALGAVGLCLIVGGMVGGSLSAARP